MFNWEKMTKKNPEQNNLVHSLIVASFTNKNECSIPPLLKPLPPDLPSNFTVGDTHCGLSAFPGLNLIITWPGDGKSWKMYSSEKMREPYSSPLHSNTYVLWQECKFSINLFQSCIQWTVPLCSLLAQRNEHLC